MISIDQHKESLNQTGLEMLQLCGKQLNNSWQAFSTNDNDLAEAVLRAEKRVNALEIRIERDCERFIALYNPVAGDLRFALALMKINFNLERIGDHAYGISKYITEVDTPIAQELYDKMRIREMFESVLSMFEDITDAYTETDSIRARKVFKKDKVLDKINMQAFAIIAAEVKKEPELVDQYLLLFSVLKKLERIGDHLTNIAEEIIFIREAEIVKHRKPKKPN